MARTSSVWDYACWRARELKPAAVLPQRWSIGQVSWKPRDLHRPVLEESHWWRVPDSSATDPGTRLEPGLRPSWRAMAWSTSGRGRCLAPVRSPSEPAREPPEYGRSKRWVLVELHSHSEWVQSSIGLVMPTEPER